MWRRRQTVPNRDGVDREIEAWVGRSGREQLQLLWGDFTNAGVRVVSYWDMDPWMSPYTIYATQPRGLITKWRSSFDIRFDSPEWTGEFFANQALDWRRESDDLPPGELRSRLSGDDATGLPDLCDLTIALGRFRNTEDVPLLERFVSSPDPIVRYCVLGALTWQPSISTPDLVAPFTEDPDGVVRETAGKYATGYYERYTDPPA
jgi:hypothetical protein